MDNSSVHMIEIMMVGVVAIAQLMDMVVKHQVDGGTQIVFTSTSTTMEDPRVYKISWHMVRSNLYRDKNSSHQLQLLVELQTIVCSLYTFLIITCIVCSCNRYAYTYIHM